jgi:hypothetical protein
MERQIMVAAVEMSATPELEALEPTLEAALARLQARLNALPPEDVTAVVDGAARALAHVEDLPATPAAVEALAGGRVWSPAERVEAEIEVLARSFARRRALLADTLTASQVARLLNTSRQTPHDRVASGTLLAVLDRGAWRFPLWQFDPQGPDGVVAGLPAVLRALSVTPLAKLSWLTSPNAQFDGATPLEHLRAGELERVVALAHGVGSG